MPDARRILVVTADALAARMAGPAIRAFHIAQALAREHDARLVSTTTASIDEIDGIPVSVADDHELRQLVDWCEVVVFQGWVLVGRPWIAESHAVIVCDIYDPMHLEQLEHAKDGGPEARRQGVHGATAALNEQLRRGDFFLCASDKQRDFWLGQLAAVGRINPVTYDHDDSLRSLIDVAPFGVQDDPPVRSGPGVRGVLPGIGEDEKVILWGGGVYNWFDPLSVIKAVATLAERRPEVRLVFMGLAHPNPEIPQMQMAVAAQALSDELGLTGKVVHFNEGWVPYGERQNMLLDADVGVSAHLDHIEAAFSFRTRVLDYLWAGLPVVSTAGDGFAELIERRGFGIAVAERDVDGLQRAFEQLLFDDELNARARVASRQLGDEMRWSQVLGPLLAFCRAPRRAPDLVDAAQRSLGELPFVVPVRLRSIAGNRAASYRTLIRDEGATAVARRLLQAVRRRADRLLRRA